MTINLAAKVERALRAGEVRQAEEWWVRLAESAPDDANTWSMAAILSNRKGLFEDTLAHFDRALSLDPHFFPALFNRVLARGGRVVAALAALENVADHSQFSAQLAKTIVNVTATLSPELHLAALRLAVVRCPADIRLACVLATRYARLGRQDEALLVVDAIPWPTEVATVAMLADCSTAEFVMMARCALQAKRSVLAACFAIRAREEADAATLLDTALEQARAAGLNLVNMVLDLWTHLPDMAFTDFARQVAAGAEGLADGLVNAGRLPAAERVYTFLAAAGWPNGLLQLGNVQIKLGKLAEAEASFKQLLDWPEALDALPASRRDVGIFLLDRGRFAEARPVLERALEIREDPQTLNALGRTLMHLNEEERGHQLIERGEWLAPQTKTVKAEAAHGNEITALYANATPPRVATRQPAPWPTQAKDFAD